MRTSVTVNRLPDIAIKLKKSDFPEKQKKISSKSKDFKEIQNVLWISKTFHGFHEFMDAALQIWFKRISVYPEDGDRPHEGPQALPRT